ERDAEGAGRGGPHERGGVQDAAIADRGHRPARRRIPAAMAALVSRVKRAYQRGVPILRRDLLVSGDAGGAALLAASAVAAAAPQAHPAAAGRPKPPAGPGKHEAAPLPFKASSLTGISEKMITSHHDKNYVGAVNNLNKVEADLAALKPDAPGYLVAGLRE